MVSHFFLDQAWGEWHPSPFIPSYPTGAKGWKMLDNCPALRLFALTYSGWGMFGDVGMGYPDGYDKEVYIRIYIYIYIKKKLIESCNIYIYIIHTGETIEKPVDLGVRYVQTNPYIIPSIYSRLFQYVWKWSRIRPAAPLGYKRFTIMSTSPVHSEAWRWRRWHLQTKAEAPGTRCHWSANRQATQDARFRHQGEGVTGTFLRLQQPQAKAGVERFCPGCLQSHGTPSGTAWHGHVAILNCLAPNWSCLIMEHVMIHLLGFSIDLASTKSIHIYIYIL